MSMVRGKQAHLKCIETCYMVLFTRNQGTIRITIDNMELSKVLARRYLGVTLDEELEWKNHIDIVYGKLTKFVRIFYKLRNELPSADLHTIYYSCVHPHILYDTELYANTHLYLS
jgi:hypothetical protein